MKKLPKELTPELLSLVLDEEVIGIGSIDNNVLDYAYTENPMGGEESYIDGFINLDTLEKKMKKWCLKQGYWFDIKITLSECHIKLWHTYLSTDLFKSFKERIELEAITKATHFIAKEIGAICLKQMNN